MLWEGGIETGEKILPPLSPLPLLVVMLWGNLHGRREKR